jgi:inhibitor of KinA
LYEKAKYLPAGDRGVVVELGNAISPQINERVRGFLLVLEDANLDGIVSVNTTYRSLLIEYDPLRLPYGKLLEALQQLESRLYSTKLPPARVLEVPTLYGGEFGPDLDFVAQHAGISKEEVIRIHHSTEYLIYMLGFTPGFSYLGGMDPTIETPRLKSPRGKIPGGSVGIAGKQTGIYSIDSPGGWQLIGRTPIRLYDPDRQPPILHQTGDYIRFIPITREEYDSIEKAVRQGTYEYRLVPRKGADEK